MNRHLRSGTAGPVPRLRADIPRIPKPVAQERRRSRRFPRLVLHTSPYVPQELRSLDAIVDRIA